jgi:hypothetical protein
MVTGPAGKSRRDRLLVVAVERSWGTPLGSLGRSPPCVSEERVFVHELEPGRDYCRKPAVPLQSLSSGKGSWRDAAGSPGHQRGRAVRLRYRRQHAQGAPPRGPRSVVDRPRRVLTVAPGGARTNPAALTPSRMCPLEVHGSDDVGHVDADPNARRASRSRESAKRARSTGARTSSQKRRKATWRKGSRSTPAP